jgi:ELWxxDGT repeat protein
MSLAELFGLKETWRQRVRRTRRNWLRSRHQSFSRRSPAHLSHFTLEMLEPRLLLNAAPVAETIAQEAIVTPAEFAPSPLVLLDGDAAALEQPGTGAEGTADPEPAARHEVVFIDAEVHDARQLISGLSTGSDVFILDDQRDGIAQISEALAGLHNIDAVHFVTHGSSRLIKLGATWLTQESLAGYADQIRGWSTELADGADLLFYACDIGGSSRGQALLSSIHALTGADIAASTNDTGNAQYGADWNLEYQLGTIETGSLLTPAVQNSWTGLLDTFTVTTTADSGGGSLRQAILDANSLVGTDRVIFAIGTGVQTISPLSALPTITDPLIIDGTTQPGYAGTPLIELDGVSAGASVTGLNITAGNSTIRGLAIIRFDGNGIALSGPNGGNLIEGNHIGLDAATGSLDLGNTLDGILITDSSNNRIGGTAAGTVLAEDIAAGVDDSFPISFTNVNGTLFFSATDGVNGQELWKTDGTAAGTVLVKDILGGAGGSNPQSLINVNGMLFFMADDGVDGAELWKSDGTAAGTMLVKDILAGAGSSNPRRLMNVNGTLFFSASDGVNGEEPWKSDGTAAGTVLLKDILAGAGSSLPTGLVNATNVNGTLFFSASDGVNGQELWKTDGSAAGTVLVKDILAGAGNSNPQFLTNVNGTLFFSASDGIGVNGRELWKSDGTAAGTVLVKDISPGDSTPSHLTNVNGTLVFTASTAASGRELWKSDGTAAGTVLVKDIMAGTGDSLISPSELTLTNVNGTLFFSASDGVNGEELWKTDGTAAGTVLVKDIAAGVEDSFPSSFTNVNGTLFFSATDGVNGQELWKSDGTAAGTMLVKDILAGAGGSDPFGFMNMNGTLFFQANDGVSGIELWKSDGTFPQRNVISGNNQGGIKSQGAVAGTVIVGNYIGTNATGTAAVGNAQDGIAIQDASGTIIGGPSLGSGNVISGNSRGLWLFNVTGTVVQGNRIGTDVSGNSSIGNSEGISISSGFTPSADNVIGGTEATAGNIIAFNTSFGITLSQALSTTLGTKIQGNSIFSNTNLGIDIGGDGVTANDSGDLDSGPNNLQNFPVLTNVTVGNPVISGTLNSRPNTTYTLEFFSNAAVDLSGFGEGQTFLGRSAVTTDNIGNGSFTVILSTPVTAGQVVTATATDPNGNTSEFSAGLTVLNGALAQYALTVKTNGTGSGRVISFPIGIDVLSDGASPVQNTFEIYPDGTLVDLTANPDAGSSFIGWSGLGISSSSPTLTLPISSARTVTATFQPTGSLNAPSVNDNLNPANETNLYRLQAQAGDQFLFDLLTTPTTGSNAIWRLFDPYNTVVFSGNFTADQGPFIVQQTGTYTLAIEGAIGSIQTGSYIFTVVKQGNTPPAPPPTANYTIGTTLSDTVTSAASDTWVFTLTDTKFLVFDSFTNSSVVTWTVNGPPGTIENTHTFQSADNAGGPFNRVLGTPLSGTGSVTSPGLPAGTYLLTVNTSQASPQAYSFRLLDVTTGTAFSPGTPQSGTLGPGTETDIYQFNAIAGDRVYFDSQTQTGGTLTYYLLDPSGWKVSGFGVGGTTDVETFTLSLTGTYILLVVGAVGNSSNVAYTFNVQPVLDGDFTITEAQITAGATINGAIEETGEQDRYAFTLTAARQLVLDSFANSAINWSLTGPSGTIVSNRLFSQSDSSALATGRVLGSPTPGLPIGTYTLTVDGSITATGAYSFRLLDLTAGTSLTPGTPQSGTLNPGNETDVYRFAVTAGDRFYFDAQTLLSTVNWYLIDPVGGQQFGVGASLDVDTITLGLTGTYSLLIEGQVGNGATPIAYTFNVQPVVNGASTISGTQMTTGETISGAIDESGEQDRYTFTLGNTTQLYFDALTNSTSLTWSLESPSGPGSLLITSRSFTSSDSIGVTPVTVNPVLTLPAGTYTLTIDGSGAATLAYSFRLLDLSAATDITATLGTPVVSTLNPGNETDLYKFTTTQPNQRFYFDVQSLSTPGAWRLIDPNGAMLFRASTSNLLVDVDTMTLARAGTYTVLIEGPISQVGTVNYTVNVPPVTDENFVISASDLNTGAVKNEAIDVVGEQDHYTFTVGAGGQRLYFDALSGNVQWKLVGPGGTIVPAPGVSNAVFSQAQSLAIQILSQGDYTLTIDGGADFTGAYSFRLADLTASATPLSYGTPVTSSLNPAAETDIYQFNVTAGDQVLFDIQARSGGVNSKWRLVDPTSIVLFDQTFLNGQDVGPINLNQTGSYTLLIEGSMSDSGTATYTFNVALQNNIPPTPYTGTAYTLGSSVSDTVINTTPDNFVFTLSQASRLYFDPLTQTSAEWSLFGPSGPNAALVSNRAFTASNGGQTFNPVLSLPAGSYQVRISTTQSSSQSYSFQILDLAAAPTLVPGVPTVGESLNPNQTDLFKFNATANDRFYFDVQALSGGQAWWRLLDPLNNELFDAQVSGVSSDVDTLTLPLSGTYTLTFEGVGNTAVNYTLNVQPVVDEVGDPFALTLNQTVSGAVDVAGEQDTYTFSLASETRVHFDALTNNGSFRWTLVGPAGADFPVVSNLPFTSSDYNAAIPTTAMPLVLKPGSYSLIIDGNVAVSGSYSFRLVDLASATPVTPGTSITSQALAANETDLYRFTTAGNEKFYFDVLEKTGTGTMEWVLLDPYNNAVFIQGISLASSDVDTITLIPAGSYTLLVEGDIANTGSVTYGFNVQPVVDGAFTITDTDLNTGALKTGTISVSGEQDLYTFSLSDDSLLYLDSLTNDSTARWSLIGPGGTIVSNRTFLGTDAGNIGSNPVFNLPAGDYTLTIDGSTQATPSYFFHLWNLAGATSLTPGTPVAGDLGKETDPYRFTAAAGDKFYFDVQERTGASFDYWRLVDPYGNLLFLGGVQGFQDLNANQGPLTLAAAGTYTLLVEGGVTRPGTDGIFTADAATDTLTLNAHGFNNGVTVQVSNIGGALPGGVVANTLYYIVNATTNTFKLSTTLGGAAINLTNNGTGTQFVQSRGSYQINVQPVTDETFALILGATNTDVIDEIGEQDHYLFTLGSAARVYFDSLTNNANIRWSITGPMGLLIGNLNGTAGIINANRPFNVSFDGVNTTNPILDLPAGSYDLIVTSTNEVFSGGATPTAGNYSFRLLDLAKAPEITPFVPVPTFAEAESIWPGTITFAWHPVVPAAGQVIVGYNLYVGYAPGEYGDPIFVQPDVSAITLFNVPNVPHYFAVSALYVSANTVLISSAGAALNPESSAPIEPQGSAIPAGVPDQYATARNLQFSTVKITGVLRNDTDADGDVLHAVLVDGPLSGQLVAFNGDGSFIYKPNLNFTGTDTFTYRVVDSSNNPSPVTTLVAITIAQESGLSAQGTATPTEGLEAWTVLDQGTANGFSNWTAVQSPTYGQLNAIGPGAGQTGIAMPGTVIFRSDGLIQKRSDFSLNFTLRSEGSGAVGVVFRYTDANNYYRFSMDDAGGYRRLIRMKDGVATTLMQQVGLPDVYTPGRSYPLVVQAIGTQLLVTLTDPTTGLLLVNWTVNEATTQVLTGSGFGLYSANNSGSYFTLLGNTFSGPPPANTVALEVRTAGTGVGIVTSSPVGVTLPGSAANSYSNPTTVQLTATPGPSSTLSGWTTTSGATISSSGQVTLNQNTIVTASFAGVPRPLLSLDVNADGAATPQDAIVILRYLSLVTGPALTAGVVTGGQRTDPAAIKAYLDGARTTMLDVNQDGAATPQDAIVILRHLSLVSGPALTAGVITGGAQTDSTLIKLYLNRYTFGAGVSSSTETNGTLEANGLTTTDSSQPLILPSDELGTEAILTPSTPDTQLAAQLVGLTDFRSDARFAGINGSGFSTVIIDTGIDVDHPYFGPDEDQNGVADRIIFQYDFGDNDPDASDRNGHGSNVASLIGSENATDQGVAPGTDFIVLKVFGDNGAGTFGNVERALQWVVANIDTYHIGVVNLSLGDGGTWSSDQSLYGVDDEFAALAEQQVILVAAAGNHYYDNGNTLGVAYPAADPAVLAVGAVWTADFGGPWNFSSGAIDLTTGPDRIASFSQRDPTLLDVLAPGARLTGASATGGRLTLQGTSQAAAFLSGTAALAQEVALQELGRPLTTQEFAALLSTGDVVLDGDNEQDNVLNTGLSFFRINIENLASEILRLHNDPPTVTPATFTLPENSAVGTVVGTVQGADPDPQTTLTYAIVAGNERGAFAIDGTTGQITVVDVRPLNFEVTPQFVLTIQATDDGSPALSSSATITVNLTNVNEAPVVDAAKFSVWDNSSNGTRVGLVTASDPDAGTRLTYAITAGNNNGAFAIDPATGALTVANRKALNVSGSKSLRLTVQATDNGTPALSGTNTVIVDLLKTPDRFVTRDGVTVTLSDPFQGAIAAQQSWVQDFVGEQSSDDDLVVMLPAL